MAKAQTTAIAKAKVNLPVDVNAAMAAEMEQIQKRISAPSGDHIMVTQGKTFKLPNGSELDELEAIVVDFCAANFYYTEAYDRGNVVPPACFALGLEPAGLVASDNSPDKQCASCAACWANQFGSSGKGKACQNTRLLALLTPDADAETPLYLLKVSPTAIKNFDAHVNSVANSFKMPVRAVVTQINFSQESEYATLRFKTLRPAEKDLLLMAHNRLEEARKRLLTEPDVSALKAANDAPKAKAKAKPAPVKALPKKVAAGGKR